jgi:hypothetical protein
MKRRPAPLWVLTNMVTLLLAFCADRGFSTMDAAKVRKVQGTGGADPWGRKTPNAPCRDLDPDGDILKVAWDFRERMQVPGVRRYQDWSTRRAVFGLWCRSAAFGDGRAA